MSPSPPRAPAGGWRTPAGVELGRARINGRPGGRLMVILRAPGCAYARQSAHGGCTNCGFWQHLTSDGAAVPGGDLLAQLRAAMGGLTPAQRAGVMQLDIFCSGSFLCDGEIPPEARVPLLESALDLPALEVVMVESRPEYITPGGVGALTAALAGRARLEIGVGLESADEAIREERVRKGFTLAQFRGAAEVLAATPGAALVVYLLLKPLGTSEEEALADVLASGRYLARLGRRLDLPLRVALEPTFVPEGTALYRELAAGRFTPPSLWTAARAARGLAQAGLQVYVGLSSEGLPARQVPSGCPACDARLRRALARFNSSADLAELDLPGCACQGG